MPTYRITLLQNGRDLGSLKWTGSFASAKAHAQTHFHAHKLQRGATGVQLSDGAGTLLFTYPGTPQAQGAPLAGAPKPPASAPPGLIAARR